MASSPHTLRSETDGVLELTFNRPEKLNAISLAMFAALRDAVEDLRTRPELRVMLINARGRYFSAGVDLTEPQSPPPENAPSALRGWMRQDMSAGMHRLYEDMERIEKPIVIAHHAACVGGGLELSLSCDIRLAAHSARYAFPEMKFGMIPLSGGVSRLARICGGHWTRWMVLANQEVSAERALIMGLVHEVYPDEGFEERARDFCRSLARQPAEATAAAKLAIEMAVDLGQDQSRQLERMIFSSLKAGDEHKTLAAGHRIRSAKTE